MARSAPLTLEGELVHLWRGAYWQVAAGVRSEGGADRAAAAAVAPRKEKKEEQRKMPHPEQGRRPGHPLVVERRARRLDVLGGSVPDPQF